jgi:hypothetical protein
MYERSAIRSEEDAEEPQKKQNEGSLEEHRSS